MIKGASYFGNRILKHVARDMQDLASLGFTDVLHTFSENDWRYYSGTMESIVKLSHEAGLRVQLGPWTVGHAFGGESESRFSAIHPDGVQILNDGRVTAGGCLNNPIFREYVKSWSDSAVSTGADRIMWDEPHWWYPNKFGADPSLWACRCQICRDGFRSNFGYDMPTDYTDDVTTFRNDSVIDFVLELAAHADAKGIDNVVCLLPILSQTRELIGVPAWRRYGLDSWDEIAAHPAVKTVATDPYWALFDAPLEPFVSICADELNRLSEKFAVGSQLWIQSFELGPEDAKDIETAVSIAGEADVDEVWTWCYEAGGHMSAYGTREPASVWNTLCRAFQMLP